MKKFMMSSFYINEGMDEYAPIPKTRRAAPLLTLAWFVAMQVDLVWSNLCDSDPFYITDRWLVTPRHQFLMEVCRHIRQRLNDQSTCQEWREWFCNEPDTRHIHDMNTYRLEQWFYDLRSEFGNDYISACSFIDYMFENGEYSPYYQRRFLTFLPRRWAKKPQYWPVAINAYWTRGEQNKIEKILKRLPKSIADVVIHIYCNFNSRRDFNLNKCLETIRQGPDAVWKKYRNQAPPQYYWKALYGRVPVEEDLLNWPYELIRNLKPNFKYFLRGFKTYQDYVKASDSQTYYQPHIVQAMANLFSVLGPKTEKYIQDRAIALNDSTNYWYHIHEYGIDLKPHADATVLWKWRRQQDGNLTRVANRWHEMVGVKTYQEAVAWIAASKYERVEIKALAVEAANAGYPQWAFERAQEKLKGMTFPEVETIPSVSAEADGYSMFKMDRGDMRGLFLGHYTNCCQHPDGAGESCAWHGYENQDGGFYVVTKGDKIIAQSWIWREGPDVCFDSMEMLSRDYGQKILPLYREVASKLIGKLGITRVLVGAGYPEAFDPENNVQGSVECSVDTVTSPARTPAGCYTDASDGSYRPCQQYFLAGENPPEEIMVDEEWKY